MVIDWLAQKLFGKPFDRNGALAAKGSVLTPVLSAALRPSLLPPQTAANRRTRAVRAGLRGGFSGRVPAAQQEIRRRAGHGDSGHGRDDCAELRAVRAGKDEGTRGRLHSFGRRSAKQNAGGHAGCAVRAHGMHDGHEREVWNARRGQGGRGVCAARMAHVAQAARKRAGGDGGEPSRDSGSGQLCVRLSRVNGWGSCDPTLGAQSPHGRRPVRGDPGDAPRKGHPRSC